MTEHATKADLQRLAIIVEQMLMELGQGTRDATWADLLARSLRLGARLGIKNAPIDNTTDLPVGQEEAAERTSGHPSSRPDA